MCHSILCYAFVAAVLVSTLCAASPVVVRDSGISLPIAVNLKLNGSRIPDLDRARVAAHRDRHLGKRAASIDITNTFLLYTASVGVGSPATQYTLIVDTGSSNTFFGAKAAYTKTSTSKDTGLTVSVSYGTGQFSGEEYLDTVTLTSAITISNQSIGVASSSSGFGGFDGILGLGPTSLTVGTLSDPSASIPTVTDNLSVQGTIDIDAVGVYFQPTTARNVKNGALTFGNADASRYTGALTYTGLTTTSPANAFWGIDQTVTYGTSATLLGNAPGIVDTGTKLLLLATDAFNAYRTATGATHDSTTGMLKISAANYANLQSLFFTIGGTTFEYTPNAQTWPRSLNVFIGGGSSSNIFLVVADLGSNSGSGLDFVNGYVFLERFYTHFDTTNSRFGIATTAHTLDTSN
ncbi:acid protease [Rickenella mellea]|uniref:Acid protease n=1 Tax=Rickenella mellea TaxID=50990 RepID=A0A4Y7PL20_9AGAM|nr:acid protease [Rickenella mellea]